MKNLTSYSTIKKLLDTQLKKSVINLYLILLLVSLFELLSLATIPALISFIISGEIVFLNLKIEEVIGYKFFHSTSIISLLIIIIFSLKSLFMVFANHYEINVLKNIRINIKNKLIKKYINNNFEFFISFNTSYMSRNIITETNNCVSYIQSIITLFKEIMLLLVIFSLVTIYRPFLSVMTLLTFLMLALIFYLLSDKILKKNAVIRINSSEIVFKLINQSLNFIKDIKVFGKEEYFFENFKNFNKLFESKLAFAQFISRLPRIFFEFFGLLIILGLVYFLTINDPRNSLIDLLPFLALLTVSVIKLMPSFNGISGALTHIASFKNSMILINKELSEKKYSSSKILENIITNDKEQNLYKVVIKNLNFSYNDDIQSISNLNVNLKKNSIYGIIGKSGAGKSTFINLLLGLLKPDNGSIEIYSNKKTSNIDKIISYVPQEILILDDTITNNIAFGVEEASIDIQKVIKVIEMSGLNNFIKKNNQNLNLKLGEKGINISGGEKQRIGIARSLYFDPEILILDESTNSLDNQTEFEILSHIEKLKKNMTIVVIAHRLNTLKFCDTVFYFDNGILKDNDKISKLIDKYPEISKKENIK